MNLYWSLRGKKESGVIMNRVKHLTASKSNYISDFVFKDAGHDSFELKAMERKLMPHTLNIRTAFIKNLISGISKNIEQVRNKRLPIENCKVL